MKIFASCPFCKSHYRRKRILYIIIYNNDIYCNEDCLKNHTGLLLSDVNYKKYEFDLEVSCEFGGAKLSWSEV